MSYEQNWGFTDPTDEFGAHIPLNDYGSGLNSEEIFTFIAKITFCAEFTGRLNGPSLAERFHKLKIISDFEPCSPLMVSRCIMESLPGIYANPVEGKSEIIALDTRDGIKGDNFEATIQATIQLVQETFGLAVALFDDSSDCDGNSVESDAEIENRDYSFDHVVDCLLNYISHKILETNVWHAFSSDGQKNGVYAQISVDGPTFLDVVALKGFTINSDDGSIMLRFQTASHRVTVPSLDLLVPENNQENMETSSAIKTVTDVKPLTLILLPTGEEVTVINGQKSYQGVLLPTKKKDLIDRGRDGATAGKKKNSGKKVSKSSEEDIESILLTKYDLKNRGRGYSLFLPDNKEKCDDYWRVGCGLTLKLDANGSDSEECERELSKRSSSSSDGRGQGTYTGYHLTEVTMELGDQRILPTQLLVSSIAMITSRTRRLSHSIAEQFTALLRDIPLLESVTEPTRLQTGHGISSKTVGNTMSDITDSRESCSLAGQISCSLSSRFQTASSLVRNNKKDNQGQNESRGNGIEEKTKGGNNDDIEKQSNNQNRECENEKKFVFVKKNNNIDGGKSSDAIVKRSPFTVTANSALPVKTPSKFRIPQSIPGSALLSSKNSNESKNRNLSDITVGGKRKSPEIGGENIATNSPKIIIGDKGDKTKLNHDEQLKEKKKKLDDKKGREKKENIKNTVTVKKSTTIKDTKNTAMQNTKISELEQNGKSSAKKLKSIELEGSKIKIGKQKKSEKTRIEKIAAIQDSSQQHSESDMMSQTVNITTNKQEKGKGKGKEKPNEQEDVEIQLANDGNARKIGKKGKKNSSQAEITPNEVEPVPCIPDRQNGGDDSSGDDSLSLGSVNENDHPSGDGDENDDDLFFEE